MWRVDTPAVRDDKGDIAEVRQPVRDTTALPGLFLTTQPQHKITNYVFSPTNRFLFFSHLPDQNGVVTVNLI